MTRTPGPLGMEPASARPLERDDRWQTARPGKFGRPIQPAQGEAPAQPAGGGGKAPTKTWVAFKVVSEDTGEPVPHVRLRVTLPDDTENFYTTNMEGKVRIENIKPGTCDIGEMTDKDALEVVAVAAE